MSQLLYNGEGSAELLKRYGGTTIVLKKGDLLAPFRVNDVEGSMVQGFTPDKHGHWRPAAEYQNKLQRFLPKFGNVNLAEYAVNVKLVVYRQWKRGLSRNMLSCFNHSNSSGTRQDSAKFWTSLFNPWYSSPEEALAEVVSSVKLSRAVSRNLTIAKRVDRSTGERRIVLLYETIPVGSFNLDNGGVTLAKEFHFVNDEYSELGGDIL